ncbi:MAG: dockerin type I repeat-containing protein [Clostridia bacterium]|nr:dockerin type I repeat-containing protein [Clostridia bacterium]
MKRSKRVAAILLSLLLIMTAFPVAAFAEEPSLHVYFFVNGDTSIEGEDEIPIGSTFSTSIDISPYEDEDLYSENWTSFLLIQTDGTNQYKLYENGVIYLGGTASPDEGLGWIQGFSSNSFQPGTYRFRIVTPKYTIDSTNIARVTGEPLAQPPQVNTGSLKDACLGAAYSAAVKATAGNGGALTWKVLSGKLPEGLKLAAKTGKITGKPTKKGTFDFVISVEEVGNGSAEGSYTIVVKDHEWGKGSVTKAASCEEEGEKTFTCANCGETKTETITATGHAWGEWTKLDGKQHQRVCANDASHVETAAHTWDKDKVTKKATCEENGEKTYSCTVCKAKKTEPVEATGHAWGDWKKLDDKKHERVCANDPAHVETAAHTWDKGKVTKKATCAEEGEKSFTCADCGAVRTEPVAKTEHKEKVVPGKAPTCTEAGYGEGAVCEICGEILLTSEPIPPTGHAWGDWKKVDGEQHKRVCANDPSHVETAAHTWDKGKVTKEATCTHEGEKTFTCAECGAVRTEPVAKTEHTEKTVPGKAPTCTEDGLTEGTVCAVCSAVLKEQEKIRALGHIDDDGNLECDRCGIPMPKHIEFDPPLPYTSNGLTVRVFIPAGDGGVYIEIANESGKPVKDETEIKLACYDDNGEKITDAVVPIAADLSDGEFTIVYTEIKAGKGSIDQPAKVSFGEIVPVRGYDYDESKTEEEDGVTVQKDYEYDGVSAAVDIKTGKNGEKSAVITVANERDRLIMGDCGLEYKLCGDDGRVIATFDAPPFSFADGPVEIPVELIEGASKILVGKIDVPEQRPPEIAFEPPLPYTVDGITIRQFIPAGDGSVYIEVANESGKPVKDTTEIKLSCYDENGEKIVDASVPLRADLSDGEFTIIQTEIKAGDVNVDTPAKVSFGEVRKDEGYDYEEGLTGVIRGVTVQKGLLYEGLAFTVSIEDAPDGGNKTAVIAVTDEMGAGIKGECGFEYKLCGDNGRVVATFDSPPFTLGEEGYVEIPVELIEDANKILIGKVTVPEQPTGETFSLGDVNKDEKVNAKDARLALRAAARLETLDDLQTKLADVDGDGKIKAGDARKILRAAAKLEPLPETQIAADA